MAKKQFFVTISMNIPESLKQITYIPDFKKDYTPMPVTAPGLTMIELYLKPGDDYEIITIMTDDENGRTKINYETFKNDLETLSKKLNRKLSVTKELHIPHDESEAKHIEFFKSIRSMYTVGSEIYMDVTFNSKISSISEFASLVYAEKIMKCKIQDIIYGQFFNRNDMKYGKLFSVRRLYELKELIQSASMFESINVDNLLKNFEEKCDE